MAQLRVARADVEHIRTTFSGMSERHACGLVSMAVSSYRYSTRRPANDTGLREQLTQLAQQHPRYGYRRLCVLVRRGGEAANHKRVHRLYREAGLCLRRKKRRHLVRHRAVFPKVQTSNEEWALDFVADALASHRHLRILSVVDVFTRECLALETDTSLGSVRVIRVLEQILTERGAPQRIRTDNGPEFTSRCFIAWCLDRQIELVHIRPGKPVENAHVESFHGRLREECLQVSWFLNLFDARRQIETWRGHYNTDRPHSSLGYRTPEEFAALSRAAGPFSAGVGQGVSNADPLPHTPIPAQTGEDVEGSCRMLA
jgi:putative transposase